MSEERDGRTAADLIVECLLAEGVEVVFGIPGEENMRLTNALDDSPIRYVLTRHEQAASFMAEMYGRVTGKAGVVSATLGPGAINLQLGVADATTNSTPLVALSAQVGQFREYKESHQFVDLVSLFAPITQFSASVPSAAAVPEMLRRAFKTAQSERPGAVYLAVPEDVEVEAAPPTLKPLPLNVVHPEAPSASQVERAAAILREAKNPVLLAGHGAARNHAGAALARFAEHTGVAVATTFHGKGILPDDHPNSMGTIGFMRRDYANFGFDQADVIVAVGYELQEFDPVKINPDGDKQIIHIHRFAAEVDAHYSVAVGIEGDISASLDALREAVPARPPHTGAAKIRELVADELVRGQQDDRFPLSPQRIVADTRAALGRDDIVLVDTGAVKMWMARLYPTYAANTCLISNGLSTMGFALPGALGVHLARPDRRVLAVTGDGSFLMHSQEIETAVREHLPLTVLVWEDSGYGLIEWKMRLETGKVSNVRFANPEITQYAASFGATGYHVTQAADLLPTLRKALDDDGVSIVVAPVDYAENISLTDHLGALTDPL
ncbi:acetolactate synthase large subunit [Kutzneria chonburiensis]|uniref:Acetolactate synthase large subunit n=1 Tax=Kutzneria chonburiensis TaxID=1483604 RepID=A0ABV6MLW8_9PSEU|nr:acetolactate synthase large subunit [Kutzneria chonburiensis]